MSSQLNTSLVCSEECPLGHVLDGHFQEGLFAVPEAESSHFQSSVRGKFVIWLWACGPRESEKARAQFKAALLDGPDHLGTKVPLDLIRMAEIKRDSLCLCYLN